VNGDGRIRSRPVNGQDSAPAKVDGRLACKKCGRLWFARWRNLRGYERVCVGCDKPTRDCSCEVVAEGDGDAAAVTAIPQQSSAKTKPSADWNR